MSEGDITALIGTGGQEAPTTAAISRIVGQASRNRLRKVNKSRKRNIGPSTASAVPTAAVNGAHLSFSSKSFWHGSRYPPSAVRRRKAWALANPVPSAARNNIDPSATVPEEPVLAYRTKPEMVQWANQHAKLRPTPQP